MLNTFPKSQPMTYSLQFPKETHCFVEIRPLVSSHFDILRRCQWVRLLTETLEDIEEIIQEPRGFLIITTQAIPQQQLAKLVAKSHEEAWTAAAIPFKSWQMPLYWEAPEGSDIAVYFNHNRSKIAAYKKVFLQQTLSVQCYGFLPGFCYFHGLPPEWQLPRRAEPRLQVAEGSVAVGERYVGIYPQQSPGGWQLVGKCPVKLFDRDRTPSFFLEPGDQIRWIEIEAQAYKEILTQSYYNPKFKHEKGLLPTS